MANKYEIECIECALKETFFDAKDVTHHHWKVMAWDVKKNEPICLCPDCEYGQPKKKIKK